jgi:glycosyltransferase
LGQSWAEVEHIIVDGGSTDGTIDVINKYKNRIAKFISEPDKGIYDGMNKGIRLAGGDIVCMLNSDDVYASDSVIETVARTMTQTSADVCWGDLVYVDAEDTDRIVRYWKSSEYAKGKFKRGWMPPHPTFFVRRWVYDEYGVFNLGFSIAADYELMLRFVEKHRVSSAYIPQTLVKMRVGGKSNKSIGNVVAANLECYRAWKANGLRICPLRILLKPLSKATQFIRR